MSSWTEWAGRYLGRYHIEGVIGQGAMGVVFRAQDPELQRTVAVKVLYPHLAADGELVARFRREARTAANLRHRNIVAIHDVGQEGDYYYLVMEYLEGESLASILQEQGLLLPGQALFIAEQIASALDYIHRRKLVHRDVKSTNIMVDGEGRAVLTDFGLVRALSGSTLTADGTILGTPQYLAPEQLSGGEIGLWTDVYALGVVVYEMLSGRFPFDADPPSTLLFQVLWQEPPPLSATGAKLPEEVDGVLAQAMAKEPQERYASGADLVAALKQVLPAETGTVSEVAWSAPVARERRRERRALPTWLWAVLGGIVVVLVGGGFLFLGDVFPFSTSPTATVPAVVATATLPATPEPTPQPTAPPATDTAEPVPSTVVSVPSTETTASPSPSPTSTAVPTTARAVSPTVVRPSSTPRPPTQPPPTQPPPTQPPPTPEPPTPTIPTPPPPTPTIPTPPPPTPTVPTAPPPTSTIPTVVPPTSTIPPP